MLTTQVVPAPPAARGRERTLPAVPFEAADLRRLTATMARAVSWASADAASRSPVDGSHLACDFTHCAVLLFPNDLVSAMDYFAARGLDPLPPSPSVLVRRRISERYGLAIERCPVWITGLRPPGLRARTHLVEVFLFPRTAEAWSPELADNERSLGYENHVAFDIREPNERLLERLIRLLPVGTGLVWEGGGHNPHDGRRGCTVLYFVGRRSQRWELRCEGDFSSVVDGHPVDAARVARAYATWTAGE
jgi:hypothetical protein